MDRASILLVDDDNPCLQTFSEMLTSLGYAVHNARSGQAAIEAFAREPDRFSLVLLDQVMPGLTGIDTAKEILKLKPGTPTALLTGWFLNDRTKEHARKVGIQKIIEKPIGMQQLDRAIRKIIETKKIS